MPWNMAAVSGNRATTELRNDANIIQAGTRDGSPTIYQIPLISVEIPSTKYKVYSFGREEAIIKGHRVIMVLGATGSGKSTLINGLINYILQVDWNDQFRFKIISGTDEDPSGSQAKSQTQTLVCYTIYPSPGFKLDYTLTIIDTPGFGDTRGLEQDKIITDKIREFFTNSAEHYIDHIDAIGFVAQASLARLTANQKYVFDSVLSIFGKDIADNIMMLATFADGQGPAIIDAIKEAKIPCTNKIFKFNNSALFAKIGSGRAGISFDSMFWNMGMGSMEEFFSCLDELEPKSISLTAEVLTKRKQLELILKGLQYQIRVGICKREELKSEQKILDAYKADVEKNKNHTYKVKVTKNRRIDLDTRNAMNCTYCLFTCHRPCMAFDKTVAACTVFTWRLKCTICPAKCSTSKHFVQDFRHESYTKEEERTYEDVASRYREANKKAISHEDIVKKHQQELLDVQLSTAELIGDSRSTLSRLNEIALRADPLNAVDYIDLLIETEKNQAQPEWQSRVTALEEIRENANLLQTVQQERCNLLQTVQQESPNEPEQGKADEQLGRFATVRSWFAWK